MKYDAEQRHGIRTMRAEAVFTAIQLDAMRDAFDIDERLPRIIYMRRAGHTFRDIGQRMGMTHMACYRLLNSVTPKLLNLCGLR